MWLSVPEKTNRRAKVDNIQYNGLLFPEGSERQCCVIGGFGNAFKNIHICSSIQQPKTFFLLVLPLRLLFRNDLQCL